MFLGLYQYFGSKGIAGGTKKTLMIAVAVVVCAAYGPSSVASESGQPEGIATVQPKGLDHCGISTLREMDPNLTGTGVGIAVVNRSITYIDGEPQNDYRPNVEHDCFTDTQFNFHDQNNLPAGNSAHSTAICSILFGQDSSGFNAELGGFRYQGTVPDAKANIYEFWHFVTNYIFPCSRPEADIITVSIGSGFEYWWTRGFGAMAQHHGIIIVAGIGNGSDAYDPVLYPAAGANIIGVGVVDSVNSEDMATNLENFSLPYPEHSSFGPTAGKRCKPDIVAIGNCMAAIENEPNGYEPTGNWSSFSTPVVAGAIGLLVQKAKQQPNLGSAISTEAGNCVMKAIIMNSATKLPYWHKGRLTKDDDHAVPLDYMQGAGMLNAVNAYETLIAGKSEPNIVPTRGWDLNRLQKTENTENVYQMTIAEPAENFITATIVWNKHYENSYPFRPLPEKDADLRLEVWAVDVNDANNGYLLDYSDSNDDFLEHVHCQTDPNYSKYEIVVLYGDSGQAEPVSVPDRYGLAWEVSKKQDDNNIFWYDLNADGVVDELDFKIIVNNLTKKIQTPDSYLLGDINGDGVIDINDVNILVGQNKRKADWRKE